VDEVEEVYMGTYVDDRFVCKARFQLQRDFVGPWIKYPKSFLVS
jgi:hypothetical protein